MNLAVNSIFGDRKEKYYPDCVSHIVTFTFSRLGKTHKAKSLNDWNVLQEL